jgi:hypothetical protein
MSETRTDTTAELRFDPPAYIREIEAYLNEKGEAYGDDGQERWWVDEIDHVLDVPDGAMTRQYQDDGGPFGEELRVLDGSAEQGPCFPYDGTEFYIVTEAGQTVRINLDTREKEAEIRSDIRAGGDALYWEIEQIMDEYGIDVDESALD